MDAHRKNEFSSLLFCYSYVGVDLMTEETLERVKQLDEELTIELTTGVIDKTVK